MVLYEEWYTSRCNRDVQTAHGYAHTGAVLRKGRSRTDGLFFKNLIYKYLFLYGMAGLCTCCVVGGHFVLRRVQPTSSSQRKSRPKNMNPHKHMHAPVPRSDRLGELAAGMPLGGPRGGCGSVFIMATGPQFEMELVCSIDLDSPRHLLQVTRHPV